MFKDKFAVSMLLVALVPAYITVSTSYRFLREELFVDRCMSAYHGSVDYSKMSCDLNENHPFVPYNARHPRDKGNFLFALISLIAFLSAYLYLKAGRTGKEGRESESPNRAIH